MNPNETIGKWAVEKGLLDCWHDVKMTSSIVDDLHPFSQCEECGKYEYAKDPESLRNPDYTIYENIAPVLDKLKNEGWCIKEFPSYHNDYIGVVIENDTASKDGTTYPSYQRVIYSFTDLPTTLRDMVAELISKGEV